MTELLFEYRALDRAGKPRRGQTPAANESEAFRKVAATGLTPLSLQAISPGAGRFARISRRKKVRSRDLSHFTYQLGVLVSARIPLSEGLASIAEQERDGAFKHVIAETARRIASGQPLADALAAENSIFGDVYIETVRAAERSGNLPKVMEHLADMMERSQEMKAQIRGALMYPVCVVGVLMLAVTFLIGFVVPRFATMFDQRGIELPAFTKALMLLGNSIQGFWWAYLLGAGVAIAAIRRGWKTPRGRAAIDRALHRIPKICDILRGLALARFTRVLGMSLASGVGLIECLELAGKSSGRPSLEHDVTNLANQVRTGGRLSDALPSCGYLTPFTRRMLSAGEQSGELPRMCTVVARHYERESSQLAKNISTVIEPVLIVAIAIVVLCVALAIFLPMWDMVKLVG